MNRGIKATKNYDVKLRKSGKRQGQGQAQGHLLLPDPGPVRLLPYTYLCTGSTTFTAKPR
jgi:hypothetical protein